MQRHGRISRIDGPRGVMRDGRFLGGLVLVALSVTSCVLVVADARRGDPTYQATRTILIGEELGPSNTTIVPARTLSDAYVTEGELPTGAVAARSIGEGHLLTHADAARPESVDVRRLVIPVSTVLPQSTRRGSALELWQLDGDGAGAPATLLATSAVLGAGREPDAGSVRAGERIEIAVHVEELPRILDAVGGTRPLVAVPVGP